MTDDPERRLTEGEPASIRIRRKVEWVDTDASGHWHNTAVTRFVEMAESALWAALGLEDVAYGNGTPRVHTEAQFFEPAHFGEEIEIGCTIREVGRSKVVFDGLITRQGTELARMRVTAVLVGDKGSPMEWPPEARRRMLTAGPQTEPR